MVEFMTRLQSDETVLGRYRTDPEGTMKAFGLTSRERATLREGDADAVRALLADAVGSDLGRTAHLHVHVVVPPPPPHSGP